MKHRTLYVSDMDGTLLDNNSLVSSRSAKIISDLSNRGALITVATARTPATVDPLMRNTLTLCPAIVMTGAAFWDRNKRSLNVPAMLGRYVAREIITTFHEHGLDPFIYVVVDTSHMDVYHGVNMTPGENDFYQERRCLELKKFHIGSEPKNDEYDSIVLLFGIGDTVLVEELACKLRDREDCSVSFYPDLCSTTRSLIEVFAPGVSKARAVKQLASEIDADRIVVFGDNLNDIPMMHLADVSVAVSNALQVVKEAADIVIGPNSADSVAHFIEQDFEKNI